MKKVVNYKVEGSTWEEAKTKAFEKIVKKVKEKKKRLKKQSIKLKPQKQ